MTLGAWPLLAWAAEFVLEVSGAYFAYRKRLKILSILLVWRALMDLLTFAIFASNAHPGYGFAMWAGRAIQYAILYSLGVQLAARMIEDYRPIAQYIYKTLAVGASVAAYFFVVTKVWEHKFMAAESITSLLLLAVVLLGWIGRKRKLEEPWKTITVGLCISGAGNSLCALMAAQSSQYLSLYPVPALLALVVWNWAARPQQKTIVLEDHRGEPNQERKPVASAIEPVMLSTMVQ